MMFYVFKIIGENYNIAVMLKCLPKQRISDLRRTFCTGVSTIYGTAQIHLHIFSFVLNHTGVISYGKKSQRKISS